MVTREDVAREALTWERTPFHHHACLKGVGVDCVGFAYGVYTAVGLVEPFEIPDYAQQQMLNDDREQLLPVIQKLARRELLTDEIPQTGDLVLFRYGRCYSHVAIVIEPGWPNVIHSFQFAGPVIRDYADNGHLAGHKWRAFTLFGD